MKRGFPVKRAVLSFFAFTGISKDRAEQIKHDENLKDIYDMIVKVCVDGQKSGYIGSTSKLIVSIQDIFGGVIGKRQTAHYEIAFDDEIKESIEKNEAPASLYEFKRFIEDNANRFVEKAGGWSEAEKKREIKKEVVKRSNDDGQDEKNVTKKRERQTVSAAVVLDVTKKKKTRSSDVVVPSIRDQLKGQTVKGDVMIVEDLSVSVAPPKKRQKEQLSVFAVPAASAAYASAASAAPSKKQSKLVPEKPSSVEILPIEG